MLSPRRNKPLRNNSIGLPILLARKSYQKQPNMPTDCRIKVKAIEIGKVRRKADHRRMLWGGA